MVSSHTGMQRHTSASTLWAYNWHSTKAAAASGCIACCAACHQDTEAAQAFQASTQRRQSPIDTTSRTLSPAVPHLGPEALSSKVSAQAIALLGILCLCLPRLVHFSRLGCNLGPQPPQLALGAAHPAQKGKEAGAAWTGQQGGGWRLDNR
jgi:hypothetical protein